MAKIIVTYNGLVQQEFTLGKPRVTIGRRPSNDLVIDHLTVSGQHAAIDASANGYFILDLGSTNGTTVNGQPVKKHLLQNDDVIDIGKYKLRFVQEASQATRLAPQPAAPTVTTPAVVIAKIKVLSGANAGRELTLSKPVTTIGSPGVQVVAITRQGDSFLITHIDGKDHPKVNQHSVTEQAVPLQHGDVIDLLGVSMAFYLNN